MLALRLLITNVVESYVWKRMYFVYRRWVSYWHIYRIWKVSSLFQRLWFVDIQHHQQHKDASLNCSRQLVIPILPLAKHVHEKYLRVLGIIWQTREHSESTYIRQRQVHASDVTPWTLVASTKTGIRIWIDPDPGVLRIALKMWWIHFLGGDSHSAEFRQKRPVSAYEMLLNLVEWFCNAEGSEKVIWNPYRHQIMTKS